MGMNKLRVLNNPGGEDWPSRVLHDVSGCFEGGLNRERVRAMAGFIEGLPITWRGGRHPGPVPSIQKLDGRVDCIGYVLHAGGPGLGLVAYSAPAPHGEVLGYHLTGYGPACWAWGIGNGMSSVAGNGHVAGLQAVLTAAPIEQGAVRGLSLPDVTSAHVAAACGPSPSAKTRRRLGGRRRGRLPTVRRRRKRQPRRTRRCRRPADRRR